MMGTVKLKFNAFSYREYTVKKRPQPPLLFFFFVNKTKKKIKICDEQKASEKTVEIMHAITKIKVGNTPRRRSHRWSSNDRRFGCNGNVAWLDVR